MRKIAFIIMFGLLTQVSFAQNLQNIQNQTNQVANQVPQPNTQGFTDYITSLSASQLKSALGLDIDNQATIKFLDGLMNIWRNTFTGSNTDLGQLVVTLYDNMKSVLQGLSFDIKTEKLNDSQIAIRTWVNFPYQQGYKRLSIDYYVQKEGMLWKVYDLKIGGFNFLPLYKTIN